MFSSRSLPCRDFPPRRSWHVPPVMRLGKSLFFTHCWLTARSAENSKCLIAGRSLKLHRRDFGPVRGDSWEFSLPSRPFDCWIWSGSGREPKVWLHPHAYKMPMVRNRTMDSKGLKDRTGHRGRFDDDRPRLFGKRIAQGRVTPAVHILCL